MGLLTRSLHYYSSNLQRNDLTRQLLRPFTPDQLQTNYCHYKFQINTSHLEIVPLGGPKILLTYNSTWTSTIITHNSTQLPTSNPNYPDNPNYPKLPISLMNTQLLTNTNFTYEYYSLFKNNPHYSRIMPTTLKLLIISEIRTFT